MRMFYLTVFINFEASEEVFVFFNLVLFKNCINCTKKRQIKLTSELSLANLTLYKFYFFSVLVKFKNRTIVEKLIYDEI